MPPWWFLVHFMAAILAVDVQGRYDTTDRYACDPFSCGHLQDIQYPFRLRGDLRLCGLPSYELDCSDSKATIRINTGTYFVTDINYKHSYFWVVDANLDMSGSCPLPSWDQRPYIYGIPGSDGFVELYPRSVTWANFVNCSRAVTDNSDYIPVACLRTRSSFVYVLIDSLYVGDLNPYCGYLAVAALGDQSVQYSNASHGVLVETLRRGFPVWFPLKYKRRYGGFKDCLKDKIVPVPGKPMASTLGNWDWIWTIFTVDSEILHCAFGADTFPSNEHLRKLQSSTVYSMLILKLIAALRRFVFAPLVVLVFLAHKYWKTRITIDAVEKFLRMQQMIGPTRYAYTDIVAVTSHFRDKLGQGGYGSVYKGVLLPGDVPVAIKMLDGKSSCDGEDFISEVSTIGRIHHVNVVRLVGFCSEEMRRALVYEYMPRGSLDKYIFSVEKSFSWDKLNEIALGIARGINYLHQGCDMQILHFDIKPHNILLDSNFVPKVADFGLAKLYPRDNNFVPLSALRGTIGYMAPEMVSRSFGVISSKSDVYSFGMLLLEMAGGRRNADPNAANSSQAFYPSWVYDRLTKHELGEISAEMHELERKLCLVGLCCIQMKSHDRPAMSEVIEMLEGGSDVLQVPSRPFFCDSGHTPLEDSYHFMSELTAISEEDG
ncbi:rust resistance kinase Lr10-like [Triticum dicoccoides]|uniref:rust resistance kinase Lr10-like n=1 Tax=Triticum dicoccoides TaxID=85692 RepID=UPI000E7D1F61|nr:rust resistance kinase Lr10-like [Triticum dicoccoides]